MEYHHVSSKNRVADENQNADKPSHIEKAYTTVLRELGEDAEQQGLLRTPLRAAKAMQFFLCETENYLKLLVVPKLSTWILKIKKDKVHFANYITFCGYPTAAPYV